MLDKTFAFLEWVDHVEGVTNAASHGLYAHACDEVKALRTLPRIICLCGSTRFKAEILAQSERLTMQGNIVLAPNVFGREVDDEGKDDNVLVNTFQKSLLDALHFRKIDLADHVYIVNPNGYIGQSTHKEIKYAVRLDKTVLFMEDKVVPLDTRRSEPISVVHYMTSLRQHVQQGGEG
jgi:hypothetical protein